MPKLRSFPVSIQSSSGERLQYLVGVHVDGAGLFTTSPDSRLIDPAAELLRADAHKWSGIERSFKEFTGKDLSRLQSLFREAAKILAQATVVRELVILYRVSTKVSFWMADNGVILASGASGQPGCWWKDDRDSHPLSATDTADCYSVGFAARAMWRITSTRSTGSTVRYSDARRRSHLDPDGMPECPAAAAALNEFTGLAFPSDQVQARHGFFREIPYSDNAATACREWMLSLCRVAAGMSAFFGSPERVLRCVHSGSQAGLALLEGSRKA